VQYIFARKIDILLANGEKIFKLSDPDAALCNLFSFLSARRHAETDEKKFMSFTFILKLFLTGTKQYFQNRCYRRAL